jgi:hypothetical protein
MDRGEGDRTDYWRAAVVLAKRGRPVDDDTSVVGEFVLSPRC